MNPKKFFKVYKGPGYPVDPALEEERMWIVNPEWESAQFTFVDPRVADRWMVPDEYSLSE